MLRNRLGGMFSPFESTMHPTRVHPAIRFARKCPKPRLCANSHLGLLKRPAWFDVCKATEFGSIVVSQW